MDIKTETIEVVAEQKPQRFLSASTFANKSFLEL